LKRPESVTIEGEDMVGKIGNGGWEGGEGTPMEGWQQKSVLWGKLRGRERSSRRKNESGRELQQWGVSVDLL